MSQTRVFISSTCYDLAQIRDNLRSFLLAAGHIPVMSELPTFVVSSEMTNVENCRRNVRENADIFVLIVGSRHGSVDRPSNRSIVNLEYESAVQNNLPIIVFVSDVVLSQLPIWKSNPEADFSAVVDSPKLFQFADTLRSSQRWVFPFKTAENIIETLKLQLSIQFRELLDRKKAGRLDSLPEYRDEPEETRRIVQDRGELWEFRLTLVLLETRFTRTRDRYRDVTAGFVFGSRYKFSGKEYIEWIQGKFAELNAAVAMMQSVLNEDIRIAWGEPGVPGDPLLILRAANRIDRILNAFISWEEDIARTSSSLDVTQLKAAVSGVTLEFFEELAKFETELRKIIESIDNGSTDQQTNFKIKLTFPFTRAAAISSAIENIGDTITPDQWND